MSSVCTPPPKSAVIVETSADTRASVRLTPLGAAARRLIATGVVLVKFFWPASTITWALPSGHVLVTEPRRFGSSGETTVKPAGTAPSSGKAVAMYGNVPIAAGYSVKIGNTFGSE